MNPKGSDRESKPSAGIPEKAIGHAAGCESPVPDVGRNAPVSRASEPFHCGVGGDVVRVKDFHKRDEQL